MRILGIETSCDETAAAIVEDGKNILSNIVASQLKLHQKFGGVVPELASRAHLEAITPVLGACFGQAKLSLKDIDGIAVTQGPGLIGSLLVGLSLAKSLSYVGDLPLIGINHLEGHIYAAIFEKEVNFPFVSLIASGGHTSLILVEKKGKYRILGATRDDAAGEAFDKVAKLLGLGYPGGPIIDKLAQQGNGSAISFPRPYLPGSYDFSFSGLKTAVLYYLKEKGYLPGVPLELNEQEIKDIAASFQAAVLDVLVKKSLRALKEFKVETLVLGGGVTANQGLRKALTEAAGKAGVKVHIPPLDLATDNAAMIAAAGYLRLEQGEQSDPLTLDATANLKLKNFS